MTDHHPITLDDLRRLGACREAVQWAERQPDMATAWRICARGDWMLWLLSECDVDPLTMRQIAADCAERVLPIWERHYPNDDRPRRAIEVTRNPDATAEEMQVAAAASWSATPALWGAAADATSAALAAANAATYAANAANAAAYAADAAAYATNAAAWAAYEVTADAERAAQADIVRRYFPDLPTIKEATA